MSIGMTGVKFTVGEQGRISKERLSFLIKIMKGMGFSTPNCVKDGYYYIRFRNKVLCLTDKNRYDSLVFQELRDEDDLLIVLSDFLENNYNGYKFSLGVDTKQVNDIDLGLFFNMLLRKGWKVRVVSQKKYFFLDCLKKVVDNSDSIDTYDKDKTKYKLPGYLILGLMDKTVEDGEVKFNLSNILVIYERIKKKLQGKTLSGGGGNITGVERADKPIKVEGDIPLFAEEDYFKQEKGIGD